VHIYILPLFLCQMPTVEINILWDGAACRFQIARIFILFAAYCMDGIFNLRLPPMYAIVIIPRCFVFCMFLYKFHVLWAIAT
jgi:hypothetical protein